MLLYTGDIAPEYGQPKAYWEMRLLYGKRAEA